MSSDWAKMLFLLFSNILTVTLHVVVGRYDLITMLPQRFVFAGPVDSASLNEQLIETY